MCLWSKMLHMFRIIYHTWFSILYFIATLLFYLEDLYEDDGSQRNEKFIIINGVIQTTFWCLSLLNDIFGTHDLELKSNKPKIRVIKDNFQGSIALPFSVIIVLIYLLAPTYYFLSFTSLQTWLKNILLYYTASSFLIELFITPSVYPRRLEGLKWTNIFLVFNIFWILLFETLGLHYMRDMILISSDTVNRIPMFILIVECTIMAILINIIYVLGKIINYLRWGCILDRRNKANMKKKDKENSSLDDIKNQENFKLAACEIRF